MQSSPKIKFYDIEGDVNVGALNEDVKGSVTVATD